MAKSMSLRELLTKLSYVFPDDIYIIGNHYVIEGEKSSKRNCGTNTVILTDKVGELLNEKFDKKDIIHITNIKKGKDDLDHFSSIVKNEEKIKEIRTTMQEYIDKNVSAEKWIPFHISEEDIEMIFSGKEVEYQIDENKRIILSKSILPIVTAKTFGELCYRQENIHIEGEPPITRVVLAFDFSYFQIYLNFNYLI